MNIKSGHVLILKPVTVSHIDEDGFFYIKGLWGSNGCFNAFDKDMVAEIVGFAETDQQIIDRLTKRIAELEKQIQLA
jgi:hypothetical protein